MLGLNNFSPIISRLFFGCVLVYFYKNNWIRKFAHVMKADKKILALFKLMDDPDEEVQKHVREKIFSYGSEIIPLLEDYWDSQSDELLQQNIEEIIQKINLHQVQNKLTLWEEKQNSSLLDGIIFLSQYMYPQLDEKSVHNTIKSIHRSCWLELNKYLTPLEELHILNSIFYSMYKFNSVKNSLHHSSTYFINEVLQKRHGNMYSIAMLYQCIAQMLDLPVFTLRISNFILLAYFDDIYALDENKINNSKILFFVEPSEGTILSPQDVKSFIHKYQLQTDENSFIPLKNKEFLYYYLKSLQSAYLIEDKKEKAEDMAQLIQYLTPKEDF